MEMRTDVELSDQGERRRECWCYLDHESDEDVGVNVIGARTTATAGQGEEK